MPKKKEKLPYEQLKSQKDVLTTGFIEVQNDILRHICIDIDPLAGILYIELLSRKENGHQYSCPGIKTMEMEIGIGHTAINTYLKKLEEYGFIKVINSKNIKTKQVLCNKYFFPMEKFYNDELYKKELKC